MKGSVIWGRLSRPHPPGSNPHPHIQYVSEREINLLLTKNWNDGKDNIFFHLITTYRQSQDLKAKDVPAAVKDALLKKFPCKRQKISWGTERQP